MTTLFPVADYYAPVPLADIANGARYDNFTDAVLRPNPAAMRPVEGIQDDKAAFFVFVNKLSLMPDSPLSEHIQAVLSGQFGLDIELLPETAQTIWDKTSALLAEATHSSIAMLERFAPCRLSIPLSPMDDFRLLRAARGRLAESGCTLRPLFDVSGYMEPSVPGYAELVHALSLSGGLAVRSPNDLMDALDMQMDRFFAEGASTLLMPVQRIRNDVSEKKAGKALSMAMSVAPVTGKDASHLRAFLLRGLSLQCLKKNWTMQLHFFDPHLTADDIVAVFRTLAQLRAGYALPRVLILCRSTAFLEALASLFEGADPALSNSVSFLLYAGYGAQHLIAQASALKDHNLLYRCAGIASGISSAAGIAWHGAIQEKLVRHFSEKVGKERASAMLRTLLNRQD